MNEIYLALLGFILGILATISSQIVLRHFRLSDEKQKWKLEKLAIIRQWLESYRHLFHCQYPEMFEIVFAYKKSDTFDFIFDKTASARVYKALIEFRDTKEQCEKSKN
jgi:hypothetical protein